MINCDSFDKIAARHLEYWNLENHDRPLLDLTAPMPGRDARPLTHPGTLRDRWLDAEYMLKSARAGMERTFYAGEAFPGAFPNLGPDIFGAYFGCDLDFGEDTSWAVHHADDIGELDASQLDADNFWWKKTVELTEIMAADARGDYVVGVTDIHPGLDALVSLRGPEALCFDLYEEGDAVKRLTFDLFDRFREVLDHLNGIIARRQKGSTNWMGVYHPDRWYVTSCDFMGMISGAMMEEFVKPELEMELRYLGPSIFHLDGPGALRHLDRLLALPTLKGVQWVYGAGQPSASHWIYVLRRIQNAGKMIHVDILPEDLPPLLDALKPEGVMYRARCRDRDEALSLVRLADAHRPKRIF